jgi:micrococcal nuclease
MRKKQIRAIVVAVALVFAALTGFSGVSLLNSSPPGAVELKPADTEPIQKDANEISVQKVVDGDTFDVKINGKTERVRLIGTNAPESVDPRRAVQCFGKEASEYLTDLISGKPIFLESDPTQGDADKYGRLLRYAFLTDGADIGLMMIADGYAYEYTYETSYKYQLEYKAAEAAARDQKIGLWSDKTCGGKK